MNSARKDLPQKITTILNPLLQKNGMVLSDSDINIIQGGLKDLKAGSYLLEELTYSSPLSQSCKITKVIKASTEMQELIYADVAEIAKGGNGSIHLLQDLASGELKILKTQLSKTKQSREGVDAGQLSKMVENEIAALEKFNNAKAFSFEFNITYNLDSKEEETVTVFNIIMDFVPGETLATLKADLPLEIKVAVAIQFLKKLTEITNAGYIHGDLNPNNILVHADFASKNNLWHDEYQVKLIDFANTQAENCEVKNDTPKYVAPESRLNGIRTTASEWYAAGVILAEFLNLGATKGFIGKLNFFQNLSADQNKLLDLIKPLVDNAVEVRVNAAKTIVDDLNKFLEKMDVSLTQETNEEQQEPKFQPFSPLPFNRSRSFSSAEQSASDFLKQLLMTNKAKFGSLSKDKNKKVNTWLTKLDRDKNDTTFTKIYQELNKEFKAREGKSYSTSLFREKKHAYRDLLEMITRQVKSSSHVHLIQSEPNKARTFSL